MPTPYLLLLAAQTVALPQPDPYGPPPPSQSAARLAWNAELGGVAEDAAIEAWLKAHPGAPVAERAMLYHRLCNDYGVRIGGEVRVSACTALMAIDPDSDEASDLKVATAFRAERETRASGGTILPLIDNPLGSKSADVTVRGVTLPWFIDTGAEITTLSESTAAKIGVRYVEGAADIGTATSNRVAGRLAVVDALTIGGATLHDLQVLVLPDATLTITKDYTIPAILGLPAFVAFGRIAWLEGGKRLALGNAAPMPSGPAVRVFWHEDGLGIPMTTPIGVMGAHFDSGANKTSLQPAGLKLLDAQQAATATEHEIGIGGAGGIVRSRVKVLPRLDYTLAGAPVTATDVDVEQGEGAGTIGSDMIAQLRTLTIDFATMTLVAEPIKAR